MGFLDFLFEAADVLDEARGGGSKKYIAKCDCLELFKIGTTWRGTARVHGAGEHVKTVKIGTSTTLSLPNRDDDSRYTPRGLLRKDFRDWIGKLFSYSGSISRDMVVLNDGENCLTIEGYVKQVGDRWLFVNDSSSATYYGAYKVNISDGDGNPVGHDELKYLFKEETLGRVLSVDVTDGF